MRLCHCFIELIAYVLYFKAEKGEGPCSTDSLREEIVKRIEKSEKLSRESECRPEDYDLACFAVLVWIDETVMGSSWAGKSDWKRKPLQRQYYKTSDGGVEFYKRLEDLEPEENEVREVYYLCLASGFSGMYDVSREDLALRDHLKAKHLKRLTGTADGMASSANDLLFPESYCHEYSMNPDSRPENNRISIASVLIVSGPLVLFVSMYVLYRFILNHEMFTKLVP